MVTALETKEEALSLHLCGGSVNWYLLFSFRVQYLEPIYILFFVGKMEVPFSKTWSLSFEQERTFRERTLKKAMMVLEIIFYFNTKENMYFRSYKKWP